MTMTEDPLLKHMRAQNAALREEIVREIANLPQCDLRGVLRIIEQWKGRAALNTGKEPSRG